MTRVYLDHNAHSPLRESACRVLEEGLRSELGNPSSSHAEGRRARSMVETAREQLAELVGCHRDELVFTSGGTEANALALTAVPRGARVLAAATDHPSLLESARARGELGLLPLQAPGRLPPDLHGLLDDHGPDLVSGALANHETGALLDLQALAGAAHARSALCHTDASQAFGRVDVSFPELGVDLMTLASHKLGGPVGVGALVVRAGVPLAPTTLGGGQEGGWRAGTESALLAAAFAAAAREACQRAQDERARWTAGVAFLRDETVRLEPSVVVHTPVENAIPNTLCLSFPGRPGPALVHHLDLQGLAVSHGSACASGSLQPSAVLTALGSGDDLAASALRVSLGPTTTQHDLQRFVDALVNTLRDVPARDEKTPRRRQHTK